VEAVLRRQSHAFRHRRVPSLVKNAPGLPLTLRLPFASIAFASVVSLIPGAFLFRMGGGLLALIALGAKAPPDLLQDVIVDGATAFVIVLAMALGLIIPKLCFDRFRDPRRA